jgi:two-component sensor histidine kinase
VLEASRRIEQPQNLLVRELHHRVKNTLATVQALVGASGRSTGSFEGFYRSFSNRIASLARSHNLLTGDYWQTASLREIAPIPIGHAFAKIKAHLRRTEARPFGAHWRALGDICDLFEPHECWSFLWAAGYASV